MLRAFNFHMPTTKIEFSPFLLHDPRSEREIISLLISRPTPQELQSLGQLFMVVRVSPGDEQVKKIVESLETEGRSIYYQQLESNIELAFESMLKKLNELLSGYLEHSSTEWLDDFNAVIGVLKGSDLFFTQVGNLHAFLVHRQRIVNILEAAKGVDGRINPLKIFSQTISGQLYENDSLIICTPSILDYLSLERIRAVIQSTSTQQAVLSLENLLAPNAGAHGFGALLIRLVPETVGVMTESHAAQPIVGGALSQASMNTLIDREHQTNELLSPSIWTIAQKNIQSFFSRLQPWLKNIFRSKQRGDQTASHQTTQYYAPVRDRWKPPRSSRYPSRTVFVLGRIFTGLQFLFRGLGRMFGWLINAISGRKNLKQRLEHFPANATTAASKRIILFQRLTKQRKIVLVVAVLFIFIFAQSVIYLSQRDDQKKQQATYQQALTDANKKQEEADAALLYGNDDSARDLLKQAQDLIASIPQKLRAKQYKSEIAGLETKINALNEKTKHITTIADPKRLTDLAADQTNATAGGFVGLFGKDLTVFSTTETLVYKTNIDTNETAILTYKDASDKLAHLATGVTARYGLVALADDSLIQFDSNTNTFTAAPIQYENQDRQLVGMAVYGDRLYFLDTKNDQIFRYTKAGKGYGAGKGWLNGKDVSVTDGTSIVVDGSVYITRSTGDLSKFFQGNLDATFKLQTIEPALTSPAKVWTDENTGYFYILDPVNKRLISYTKQGRLKNQYTADTFDQLKDMVIVPKDKKAYLLNGTIVFQIDLTE